MGNLEFLEKNLIEFKREFKFKHCKDILPLPFDFFLPNLNVCIEYDGLQHFKPIKRYGGEESSNLHLDNIELQDLGGSLDDLAPEVKTYFNKGIILFNGKRYGLGSAVRKGSRATPHDYTWFEFDPSVNEWIYNTEVSLLQNRILLQVLSVKHALEDYLIRLRKDYDKRFDM